MKEASRGFSKDLAKRMADHIRPALEEGLARGAHDLRKNLVEKPKFIRYDRAPQAPMGDAYKESGIKEKMISAIVPRSGEVIGSGSLKVRPELLKRIHRDASEFANVSDIAQSPEDFEGILDEITISQKNLSKMNPVEKTLGQFRRVFSSKKKSPNNAYVLESRRLKTLEQLRDHILSDNNAAHKLLLKSIEEKNFETAKFLVENADSLIINKPMSRKNFETPFSLAAKNLDGGSEADRKLVKIMLDRGALNNFNKFEKTETALHRIAAYGDLESFETLLLRNYAAGHRRNRGELDARDEQDMTPLMYAAFSEKDADPKIQMLLKAGANPSLVNDRGRSYQFFWEK